DIRRLLRPLLGLGFHFWAEAAGERRFALCVTHERHVSDSKELAIARIFERSLFASFFERVEAAVHHSSLPKASPVEFWASGGPFRLNLALDAAFVALGVV